MEYFYQVVVCKVGCVDPVDFSFDTEEEARAFYWEEKEKEDTEEVWLWEKRLVDMYDKNQPEES